ncbi:MAG: GIY-YIG nuclease family protein [Spirochaetia bacterium]|nr:GIY-YIG nuclease family protein [Spirochaetia bacterium]
MFLVYILKCSDDSYYVGKTTSIKRRITEHVTGKGGSYTSKRLPVELQYLEKYNEERNAVAREIQLKGWSGKKKQALIDDDLKILKQYSHKPV